jgi:parallel beta-helix repeat protein
MKMKRVNNGLLLTLFALTLLLSPTSIEIPISQKSTLTLIVPNDYPTIQSAIDSAKPGATVFVSPGLYYEQVIVNKSLTLVGDNRETILDGNNAQVTLIKVTADNVKITGFKLQNSGWKWGRAGIEVDNADNCIIENNFVYLTCHQIRLVESRGSNVIFNTVDAPRDPFPQSAYGIRLENCTDCLITDNAISNNIGGIHFEGAVNCTATRNNISQNSQGIRLYSPCADNKIVGNTIFNNTNDGMFVTLPTNSTFLRNMFFHNNFINNSESFLGEIADCSWDNGAEGNYWTAYKGKDDNHDAIGDTPHVFGKEQDRYPLMGRYHEFQVSHQGKSYRVELICNFPILSALYTRIDGSNSSALTLSTSSPIGTALFCRAAFATELLGRPYSIEIDGSRKLDISLYELPQSNAIRVVLYFASSGSAHTISLIGASTIDDQASTMLHLIIAAALGVAVTAMALILWKGRKKSAKGLQG